MPKITKDEIIELRDLIMERKCLTKMEAVENLAKRVKKSNSAVGTWLYRSTMPDQATSDKLIGILKRERRSCELLV